MSKKPSSSRGTNIETQPDLNPFDGKHFIIYSLLPPPNTNPQLGPIKKYISIKVFEKNLSNETRKVKSKYTLYLYEIQ